jgi:hypothetical protein
MFGVPDWWTRRKKRRGRILFLLSIHKNAGSRVLCRVLCKEIQTYNKRFLFRAESLNEEMIIDSIQNLKKYFPMEKNQSSRSVRGNFDIDLHRVGRGGRLCIDRVPLPSDPYFRNSSDQFPQKENPKFRVSSLYRTSANTHNRILSERKRKGLSSMHIIYNMWTDVKLQITRLILK